MTKVGRQLEENLHRIRKRIATAAVRCGRDPTAVRLVAVTKRLQPEIAALLPPAGMPDLGESRVQALLEKIETLGADTSISPRDGPALHWHMIGSVQRKKAGQVLRTCSWIHSIDRPELWERLLEVFRRQRNEGRDTEGRANEPPNMLIQVNISGEASKAGFAPAAVRGFLENLDPARDPRPAGLMTMAPFSAEPEDARPVFAGLADLARDLREQGAHLGAELSMGMSADFEVAVEEGATLVRIGTRLFEGLE